ncbi:MAG: GxxExxY protein [Bacteroidetes bacterium]|nr:GxxExxY protein [Bacteroidota bacterium]
MENKSYPFVRETYALIGIAMEIHRTLGRGFLEIFYKDAFEYELIKNNIHFEREKAYTVQYKDFILPHKFFADFVIAGNVIVEIKSKSGIIDEHYAQVINYLAVSKSKIGLILNFGENSLQTKRVIL